MFCSRPWLSFIKVLKLWSELSVIRAEVSSASRCAADWPFKKDFYQIYRVCSIYFFYSSVKSSRLCYYGGDAVQRTSTSLPLQWRRAVMSAWSTCKSLLSGIQSCRAVLKGCSTSECVCAVAPSVSNISLVTVLLQSLVWALWACCVSLLRPTVGRRGVAEPGDVDSSLVLLARCCLLPLQGRGVVLVWSPPVRSDALVSPHVVADSCLTDSYCITKPLMNLLSVILVCSCFCYEKTNLVPEKLCFTKDFLTCCYK